MSKFFRIGTATYDLEKTSFFGVNGKQIEMVFPDASIVVRVMNSEEEAQSHYEAMLMVVSASYINSVQQKPDTVQ